MKENFEDAFMDIQAGLISLCLEVADGNVDKVYGYASIEKKSYMFNAFFEKDGKIIGLEDLDISDDLAGEFLYTGTMDLENIIAICKEYETQCPTEIRMYYDVNTGEYSADYKYKEVCSVRTGIGAGEVFLNWRDEMKEKRNS